MSKIEWTNETWNPIVGCSKVSAGCNNCYAEKMAARLASIEKTKLKYSPVIKKGKWNGKVNFNEKEFEKPLHWRKPRKIFVCSMGDLFHEKVQFEWIRRIFEIASKCRRHTFQILTKRSKRMYNFTQWMAGADHISITSWPRNVWIGVTCENQAEANERIPILLEIPAAVRFVSIEPMLGEVDLHHIHHKTSFSYYQVLKPIIDAGDSNRPALDWVICGGESGSNARPCHPEWVRSIRDQCQTAAVPFFFKQWGEYREALATEQFGPGCVSISPDGFTDEWTYGKVCYANETEGIGMIKVGKKKSGMLLDGKIWNQFPEVKT